VPNNVKVQIVNGTVRVEGPKGKLELSYHPNMRVKYEDSKRAIVVERPNDERLNRALHGLTRSLIQNMVHGVVHGYEKRLRIEGTGYQAKLDKGALVLTVGFANQVIVKPPAGITVEVPDPQTIVVKGVDKQQVGQFAAEVRRVRPPEPYKGKGIRYEGEVVRMKEGKKFTSGG
jgi:large subunit ribosomal protein L6